MGKGCGKGFVGQINQAVRVGRELGRPFLLELKRNDATRDVPVIVVSTTNEDRKAMSFGASAYLDKPLDPADFRRLAESVFET